MSGDLLRRYLEAGTDPHCEMPHEDMMARIEELEGEVDELAKKKAELSAQLEAEEATNDRLRDEIAEAVGARERMAKESDELRAEVERQDAILIDVDLKLGSLRARAERAEAERDELRETLKGYDATSLVLDEKFRALEKENTDLRLRAERDKTRIESLVASLRYQDRLITKKSEEIARLQAHFGE